jgi:hypothetical protein
MFLYLARDAAMTSKGLRLLAYGRVSDLRGRSGETFIPPEDQMAKCRASQPGRIPSF